MQLAHAAVLLLTLLLALLALGLFASSMSVTPWS